MISYVKYIITFIVLSIIISCEKVEIGDEGTTSESPEPVFFTEIIFQGETLTFNAGDQDFFMYTSPSEVSDSLLIYSSLAKTDECLSSCNQSFTLEVYDPSSSLLQDVEYAFPFGGGYITTPSTLGNLVMTFDSETIPLEISWDYLESESPISDSISVIIDPFAAVAIQPIQVELKNIAVITLQPINWLSDGFSCMYQLKGEVMDSVGSIISIVSNTDNVNSKVNWSNGVVGNQVVLENMERTVVAEITSSNGCDFILSFDFLSFREIELLDLTFQLNFIPAGNETTLLPGGRITYVDANGQKYQSLEVGDLRIYDIEDYIDNENGLPTLQYSVDFSTVLFNERDPFDMIEIKEATARLATLKK